VKRRRRGRGIDGGGCENGHRNRTSKGFGVGFRKVDGRRRIRWIIKGSKALFAVSLFQVAEDGAENDRQISAPENH
jgi:hypothetical protein